MAITLHAEGAASAEVVWQRYVDTRCWPQWSPQIRRVEIADGPLIGPDSTGRVQSVLGPSVHFEVTAFDASARTWGWNVRLGPIRLHLRHRVVATHTGSRTELDLDGPLPVVVGYAPLAQLALQRLVRPER